MATSYRPGYKALQTAVVVSGAACLALYPLAVLCFMMIVGLYATLGVFLINAARRPGVADDRRHPCRPRAVIRSQATSAARTGRRRG